MRTEDRPGPGSDRKYPLLHQIVNGSHHVALRVAHSSPPTRNRPWTEPHARLHFIMQQTRPYKREHYRLAVTYPAMFSDAETIGEGTITNLSVFGCTMECADTPPEQRTLLVRLILPDQKESLPIEVAEIRWVKGRQFGLQFNQLERKANLRLHGFVWDRMLDRLRAIKEQHPANPCA